MATIDFPLPDRSWPALAPFWSAAQRSELCLPKCGACGQLNWYPQDQCGGCGGPDFNWVRMSGRGTLFSWAIVNRALHPPLAALAPYVSAIVTLEEDVDTRLVTRIVDANPDDLLTDQPVEVYFADLGYPACETGVISPLFRIARGVVDRAAGPSR